MRGLPLPDLDADLLEALPVAAYVAQLPGLRLLAWNRRLARLAPGANLIPGEPLALERALARELADRLRQAHQRCADTGAAASVMVPSPDGSPRHLEAHVAPLDGPPGQRQLVTLWDVADRPGTERRVLETEEALRGASERLVLTTLRAQEAAEREAGARQEAQQRAAEVERLVVQLESSNAALADAARRKDEFLGVLSHELRNPLAPILNSVYLLDRCEMGSEQSRRAREVIGRQVHHLARLLDDLLDVTRLARGKIALHRERVSLNEVVRRAGEDYHPIFASRGVELVVALPPETLWADADPTRLAQVLGNLLQNAVKYTPADGQVALALGGGPGGAVIRVRDSGAGIEPSLMEHIFEPFTQGEQTLARSGGGLGLGLALVKGLVELHGGRVRGESAGRGQGAELTVELPLAAATEATAAATPGQPSPRAGHRVLVVEDNPDAAETLAQVVEMLGHHAEIAHDGPSAVAQARAHPPDVILCDIGLPGMSGYDVARTLRRDEALRETRLIAVSGYAQPEDQRQSAEAGFDRHVAKPPDLDEIARLLQ